jgi:hypothetical protein
MRRMLVMTTTSVDGMMFKVVAPATTTVAGLELLGLVVILLSAACLVILSGAADLQAPTSPTACQATSLSGIIRNAKAKDKKAANLRVQVIGMRVTLTITAGGMICKAVEAVMITVGGLASMVLEVIRPKHWRRDGHGGVVGWQAPIRLSPSEVIFRVGATLFATMALAFVLLMPNMLVSRQLRHNTLVCLKPNMSRRVLWLL